jgi:PqqD family protein of HPr-rel-A system
LRWRAVSPESLAWRHFDGQSVVHNARTGSTHLLGGFPAEVLGLMAKGSALSPADLAAQLLSGEETSAEWEAQILKILVDFERLGLVEPEKD